MDYSKELLKVVKQQNDSNLTTDTIEDVLNIIYLEGALSSLKRMKRGSASIDSKKRYDFWISKYSNKLQLLTQNLSAKKVSEIMGL